LAKLPEAYAIFDPTGTCSWNKNIIFIK
jgi:hypothetical protein